MAWQMNVSVSLQRPVNSAARACEEQAAQWHGRSDLFQLLSVFLFLESKAGLMTLNQAVTVPLYFFWGTLLVSFGLGEHGKAHHSRTPTYKLWAPLLFSFLLLSSLRG